MRYLLSLIFLYAGLQSASAQPRASDVESVDAIMTAVYDAISGPAGQRDWDRFRALFAPGAQLIPIRVIPDTTEALFYSVEGYIEFVDPYFMENNFFEVEIARRSERYGHILHAFSTYESLRNADDSEPFARGINSFQLYHDGDRWWVVNIMWDSEREGQPIPDTYLPN